MVGPLRMGEQRNYEPAAVGSHSATSTGKAVCVKIADRGQSTAKRWRAGDYILWAQADGSQFYHETLYELLIPRFFCHLKL